MTYGFDGYGRLNAVTDTSSSYSYGYVGKSNLLASESSPVHTTSYSYETNRDLKTDVQNGGYSSYAYRYDAIGRRTDRAQSGSAFAQDSFDAFGYNTRSEVIDSKRYLGTDPTDSSSPVVADVFAYDFDPIGNRLSASTAGVSESYVTNELNQYLSAGPKTFTHDADGNLTHDGNRNFTWTAENRLKSVEPVVLLSGAEKTEFAYDYLGRRIQKTVSEWNGSFYAVTSDEKFLYDGWNLVAVYDATKSNALTKTHTWGLDLSQSLQGAGGVGGLLGVEELSGTHSGVYHFALDANGNVTEALDDSGSIAAHYEYSPFGEIVRSSGSYADANAFRFSTKYWDEETEFYYYGYRHYDPAMGRWLNKDPLQEEGGLNLYGFVNNSAIGFFDYLGLSVCKRSWWDKLKKGFDDYVIEPGKAGLQGGAAYVDQFIPGSPLEKAGAYDPSNPLLQSSIGIGKGIDLATSVTGVKGLVKGGIEAGIKQGAKHADKAASALSKGAKPPNMSPPRAGRKGAFNEAKRQEGIPTSQQPSNVKPNTDKRGNRQPGRQYEFDTPSGKKTIRDDAGGHSYPNNPSQNRGPHFNDSKGNHYDY